MGAPRLDKWADTAGSVLRRHRFLNPPHGYVIGVALWPVYFAILSVWGVVLLSSPPTTVVTVAGLVVGGGFVLMSVGSALVMGVTAWNTSYERIRRQVAFLSLSLIPTALLFRLYLEFPTIPYRHELGLSLFLSHEISKIALLAPAIGLGFVIFPLVMLVHRLVFE